MTLVRDACCRHTEIEAQQRGLRFVLDLPETLMVSADGDALARVYVNVIDNAVKFSLPDGEVRISLREADGAVEMMCADDGVGMSEADQATVFDMFRRARDAQARDVPGSGVGLAICQRIVARLGGGIDLVSTMGEARPSSSRCRRRAPCRRRSASSAAGQRSPTSAARRPAKPSAGTPAVTRLQARCGTPAPPA